MPKPEKIDLEVDAVFKKTWENTTHYFWDALILIILLTLIALPIALLFIPLIFIKTEVGAGIYMTLAIILAIIAGIFYLPFSTASVTRFFVLSVQGKKESYKKTMKWALGKIGNVLMLGLRTFIYSYAWLIILIILAYFGSMAISKSFNPILPLLFLLAILGVLALVTARSTRAYFGLVSLVEKDTDSKPALLDSIHLVQNRWWKTFGYILLFIALPNFIYQIILGIIDVMAKNNGWESWQDGFLSLIFLPVDIALAIFTNFFIVCFYFALRGSSKKQTLKP